jgi:general stress protein 26
MPQTPVAATFEHDVAAAGRGVRNELLDETRLATVGFGYWSAMSDRTLNIADLKSRIEHVRTAMVTTLDERGTLSSRPLTVQRVTDSGDVLFIVDSAADWLSPGVEAANVSIVDEGRTWISIAGRATPNPDPDLLAELWDDRADSYFPEGRDAGQAITLEVSADRWEYWTTPNRLSTIVGLFKAAATATAPDIGESGTIEM